MFHERKEIKVVKKQNKCFPTNLNNTNMFLASQTTRTNFTRFLEKMVRVCFDPYRF